MLSAKHRINQTFPHEKLYRRFDQKELNFGSLAHKGTSNSRNFACLTLCTHLSEQFAMSGHYYSPQSVIPQT